MSDSTQSSYKQIMKATSIFGGVQIFQILIGIIRSKFIALILGPAGIGLVGLYMTATSLIQTLTGFGLSTSAVKDIAEANESDDHERISKVSSVLNKLVWITGLSGALIVVLFSKYLSILTFGNPNYTWAFIWLSSTLVLNQITSGQYVILQGMRQIKKLAKANVFGSFFGLIIVIPLYYYYGIDGVVPGIISMAITSLLVSVYYSSNFKYKKSELSIDETITIGKGMLKMGFMLSLTSVFTAISAYILRVIISNLGGINDVGYYSAGFTIIITYTGMIFNAMSTDYYPKLSAISNDNTKSISLINNQAEVGILLLSPILLIFIIFINWIIVGLYSQEFLIITKMIHWTALGMYFKAASWSVAFILLAKGNTQAF